VILLKLSNPPRTNPSPHDTLVEGRLERRHTRPTLGHQPPHPHDLIAAEAQRSYENGGSKAVSFPQSLAVAMASRPPLPSFWRPPPNLELPSTDLATSPTDLVTAGGGAHSHLCRVRAVGIRHPCTGGGGAGSWCPPLGLGGATWWPPFLTGEGQIQWVRCLDRAMQLALL